MRAVIDEVLLGQLSAVARQTAHREPELSLFECTNTERPRTRLVSPPHRGLEPASSRRAAAERPALDSRRVAVNAASSRSHCIFTICVESRPHGSTTVRRSKLHLVDLAGSERVGKSGASGATLNEALNINSSLHFLELVIMVS